MDYTGRNCDNTTVRKTCVERRRSETIATSGLVRLKLIHVVGEYLPHLAARGVMIGKRTLAEIVVIGRLDNYHFLLAHRERAALHVLLAGGVTMAGPRTSRGRKSCARNLVD